MTNCLLFRDIIKCMQNLIYLFKKKSVFSKKEFTLILNFCLKELTEFKQMEIKYFIIIVCAFLPCVYLVEPNLKKHVEHTTPTPTPTIRARPLGRPCSEPEKDPLDKELRIAWLAPDAEYHNLSASSSVGSIKLALTYIKRMKVFSDYELR